MKVEILIIIFVFLFVYQFSCAQDVAISSDDSVNSYSFNVKIGDIDVIDIIRVEGLGIEISVEENQSNTSQIIELFPGKLKSKRITLQKRFNANPFFKDWIEKAHRGTSNQYRKSMIITLYGYSEKEENVDIIHRWRFFGCFPVLWELSPLNISSNEDLIEKLQVICKWLAEDSNL